MFITIVRRKGDGLWRSDMEPALDSLMARILARDNVQRAWARVKSNQGAPGSDGMTLADFPVYARAHWAVSVKRFRQG
jgi:RNA-directed DNA polymerase